MKVGDKVKINFAGKQKEAVVHKAFDNTVYLKADFERDKGKIIKRKMSELGKKTKKDKK